MSRSGAAVATRPCRRPTLAPTSTDRNRASSGAGFTASRRACFSPSASPPRGSRESVGPPRPLGLRRDGRSAVEPFGRWRLQRRMPGVLPLRAAGASGRPVAWPALSASRSPHPRRRRHSLFGRAGDRPPATAASPHPVSPTDPALRGEPRPQRRRIDDPQGRTVDVGAARRRDLHQKAHWPVLSDKVAPNPTRRASGVDTSMSPLSNSGVPAGTVGSSRTPRPHAAPPTERGGRGRAPRRCPRRRAQHRLCQE